MSSCQGRGKRGHRRSEVLVLHMSGSPTNLDLAEYCARLAVDGGACKVLLSADAGPARNINIASSTWGVEASQALQFRLRYLKFRCTTIQANHNLWKHEQRRLVEVLESGKAER